MFVNITTVAGKNTTNQKHTATTSLRKYCFFVSCAMGTFMYCVGLLAQQTYHYTKWLPVTVVISIHQSRNDSKRVYTTTLLFKQSNLLTFLRVCMSFIPSYYIHTHAHTYNARHWHCFGDSALYSI